MRPEILKRAETKFFSYKLLEVSILHFPNQRTNHPGSVQMQNKNIIQNSDMEET